MTDQCSGHEIACFDALLVHRIHFLLQPADAEASAQAGELSPLGFDLRHSSNRSKGRPSRLLNLFCLSCLPLLS